VVTVAQTFQETAAARPHYPALRTHRGEIDWTWADYRRRVGERAAGVAGLGWAGGDTLACWLTNRPEFHVADIAAAHLAVASFSVLPSSTSPQAADDIAVAGCQILVTEKLFLDRALDVRASGSTALRTIVCLDGGDETTLSWQELIECRQEELDLVAADGGYRRAAMHPLRAAGPRMAGQHMRATTTTDIGKALGTDYFLLRSELTEQDTDYLDRTRRFVEDEVLPSFKDTGRVLASTRLTSAFAALGHAVGSYDAALSYCRTRKQFGKPLISFQIVQERLVRMLAEVTAMQLYCLRVGRLGEQDGLRDTIAGLAKMNNTSRARHVIAEARDLLGGNGILLENHVIRHMADIEAIHTFEGTETNSDADRGT